MKSLYCILITISLCFIASCGEDETGDDQVIEVNRYAIISGKKYSGVNTSQEPNGYSNFRFFIESKGPEAYPVILRLGKIDTYEKGIYKFTGDNNLHLFYNSDDTDVKFDIGEVENYYATFENSGNFQVDSIIYDDRHYENFAFFPITYLKAKLNSKMVHMMNGDTIDVSGEVEVNYLEFISLN